MPEPTTIEESIEQSAIEGIDSVMADGQQVRSKSLDELIRADRYLKGESAMNNLHGGLYTRVMVPPGGGG